ncbi:agmatine deiminase family protein [Methylocaldum sp.]|uniref:agmatine deiminase family protein n=1 Tax=Methylocaldum sp. TaxID=1969727 RepID=UPI002D2D5EC8|nr:agmatine deiminase family protein [Methylocaldum sp.]HYE38002.1 agmatine deiminase family protein [Methylocaldum sp.]
MTSSLLSVLAPEWAEQSAVLIAWPYSKGDFNRWLNAVEETYDLIALEISRRETVIIVCQDDVHQKHIRQRLTACAANLGRVRFAQMPYDDVWVRDTAPLTLANEQSAKLIDFRFNGWGGKYPHEADAQLAQRLYTTGLLGDTPINRVDFILEGGSVESDGEGTIMTTGRCLFNPNRNSELTREQIENRLKTSLGARRILWLDHGYAEGDDTDAHIDTLARFCSPDTIAYTACDNSNDSLYGEFNAMENQLRTFLTSTGQPYRLIPLNIPKPIYSEEGDRLPATYANFLIINEAVLVPVYDDPADSEALERLADCFPDREIIGIPCIPLIRQYGSLHCMTMQFPKTVRVT